MKAITNRNKEDAPIRCDGKCTSTLLQCDSVQWFDENKTGGGARN